MDIDLPFGITAYPPGFARRAFLAGRVGETHDILSLLTADTMHPLDTTANAAPSSPERHMPEQQDESQQLRDALKPAYDYIATKVPEGRYKSLALTMIETASMWGVKAIFHRT